MLNLERKSFASTNVVSVILEHDALHLVTSVISHATTQKFVSIFLEKVNSKAKKLLPRQHCYNNNLRKLQIIPKQNPKQIVRIQTFFC
jgi:hypothetical protein